MSASADPLIREQVTTPAPRGAARFLAAVGISLYGDWLTTVALVVLLFRLTGSATAPALYILVRVAPRVVGPFIGGTLADDVGPIRIAASCSLIQGVLTGVVVLLAAAHLVWPIYLVVAVAQFLSSVAQPAWGALIPRVSSERNLGRINGLYSSLFASALLVSPALGALLLPVIPAEWLITFDALTFLVAATLLLTLHRMDEPRGENAVPGVLAVLPVVLRDGTLRSFAAAWLANPAVITALQAVLVVVAAQRFGHDTEVGWLYAAVGAGGLIGSLSFMRTTPARVTKLAIVFFTFVELAPLALFVWAPNLILGCMLLFVSSIGGVLWQVYGSIGMQQRIPAQMLGRANAVTRTALSLGMLLGALAATALVQPLGWQATVLVTSGSAFLLILIAAAARSRHRFVHPATFLPD